MLKKNFNYGNFHLKYNMTGEITVGTGIVKVHDIYHGTPDFLLQADCLFTDPPCSRGNLKSFYTKAEMLLQKTYEAFNNALFETIDSIKPKYVFIEVFKSNKAVIEKLISDRYSDVSVTQSYYYHDKEKVCWIVQASDEKLYEIPYFDEQYVIEYICREVDFKCIADPCMGRGLVGFYANKYSKKFVGTELNEKRLAVLIERINNGKI
jgi:hypothetical protein